jgi:5-oxoprolinase (ATP-hydrolysing)
MFAKLLCSYHIAVVEDYGLETVQEYMYHIRHNAEKSVRNLLRDVAQRAGSNILTSIDYLDDGSPVRIVSCPSNTS